jgi:hypothetical protein
MGHYVIYRKVGATTNFQNNNYGACHSVADSPHEFQKKEYQSEAFWEGFATFYAAIVFNDLTQSDCLCATTSSRTMTSMRSSIR